jgi:uncharacterized iron-regulated membrane protein
MTRLFWTLVHRWIGLAAAIFLFVSGLTGAVISWDHELDDLLNPHLTQVDGDGPYIPSLELARAIEARDPRARVTYVPLAPEPGEALSFGISARVDPATGLLHELGYNEVFVDPVTGIELGRRDWGAAWPVTRENFISFLYVLHYSLHIPEMWGEDRWGLWLLGGVAALWTLDCFVGFYLTFPPRREARAGRPRAAGRRPARSWRVRWAPAWKIKTTGGAYRINFDVHRAFGLWTWLLLFILAFTAFSLNLYREAFYPAMSLISEVTPSPFDLREEADEHAPIGPALGFAAILERAGEEARRRGWAEPAGDINYSPGYGVYSVSFYEPGDDHGAAGVGPPTLHYDGRDGRLLDDELPWAGTAADIFVQAQFPLHSGRILGLPGRILVSAMGLVVAALSVTGVVIWLRKGAARSRRRSRKAAAALGGKVQAPAE